MKKPTKRTTSTMYKCSGGPYNGKNIRITDGCGDKLTMTFSASGFHGHYRASGDKLAVWNEESKHAG